jgi:hypothetical protein
VFRHNLGHKPTIIGNIHRFGLWEGKELVSPPIGVIYASNMSWGAVAVVFLVRSQGNRFAYRGLFFCQSDITLISAAMVPSDNTIES